MVVIADLEPLWLIHWLDANSISYTGVKEGLEE